MAAKTKPKRQRGVLCKVKRLEDSDYNPGYRPCHIGLVSEWPDHQAACYDALLAAGLKPLAVGRTRTVRVVISEVKRGKR